MRRSVRVELSTCHKVHLPPQTSLSCSSIPRHLLGKCQHHTPVLALFKNCAQLIVPSYRTQSTVCTYIHIKLLLICLLAPSYYYHQIQLHISVLTNITNFLLLFHICSNTTIITQNAQILLLSHNMLKYYYFHCTARQIH